MDKQSPSPFIEYEAARARLEAVGVKIKHSQAWPGGWLIEAVFTDRDGVGDLQTLTSTAEVEEFSGAFCPRCWRVDRRRHRGGLCPHCARAQA
jgi:hypothetical protein